MIKEVTKKTTKRLISKTIYFGKKTVSRYPRLKNYLKSVFSIYFSQNIAGQDHYTQWLSNNYPDAITLVRLEEEAKAFEYQPLVSIITPTYNTNEEFLRECIESVRSQAYKNWEMCIVDDASTNETTKKAIQEYAKRDKRIKYRFSTVNQHISGASNNAVEMAQGEFIALLDHDDLLWPNALYEVVRALNQNKKLDFLYTDEDKITKDRKHHALPFFKPDWNKEFLRSVNYITHFTVIRRTLFVELGGFRNDYIGAQDWDLFLRVTNMTSNIYHIPTVLYSWRISESSTASNTSAKPYVVGAQKKALEDDLQRRGLKGKVRQNTFAKDYWTVEYTVIGSPLVSIIIPTKDQYKIIKRCVESILEKSTYKNYEIVIVDTGTTDKRALRWYKNTLSKNPNIRIIDWHEKPFSYVRSCNEGARQARGEYLLMLNNDTEVMTPEWIELLLGYAQQEDIAAVGAKLYYPGEQIIQHAGVGIGFGGYAANALAMLTDTSLTPQQHLYLFTAHDMTAVTAACLMVRKSVFDQVNGFAEKFRITYNDVDLCLRFVEAGYRNIYVPEVRLIHHESISLGLPSKKQRDNTEFNKAKSLFKRTWCSYIEHDPAINPNIEKDNARFEINTKIRRYH